MSSDNQYTALGPAIVGFQTHGTHITKGGEMSGTQIGVRGIGNVGASGIGVQGEGVQYGIHGLAVADSSVSGPVLGGPGGTGVCGESSSGVGVLAVSDSATGLQARGGSFGVDALSTLGTGVRGISQGQIQKAPDGGFVTPYPAGVYGEGQYVYGGQFSGAFAPLRLLPSTTEKSHPSSGPHLVGELFVDSTGSLWFCKAAGTPGTWVKLA
jgi:hypothetical protein